MIERADVEAAERGLAPAPPGPRRSRPAPHRSADGRSALRPHGASTGLPPSGRYCLGTPPPRRCPLPAATMRAVTVIGPSAPCPASPRAFCIGAPSHEPRQAHPHRSGDHRRAGHPGADDGRHRPAVPQGRQALRRGADGQRDDRQPGDDPRDPPVAAEGGVGPGRGAGVAAARRLRAARNGRSGQAQRAARRGDHRHQHGLPGARRSSTATPARR